MKYKIFKVRISDEGTAELVRPNSAVHYYYETMDEAQSIVADLQLVDPGMYTIMPVYV